MGKSKSIDFPFQQTQTSSKRSRWSERVEYRLDYRNVGGGKKKTTSRGGEPRSVIGTDNWKKEA